MPQCRQIRRYKLGVVQQANVSPEYSKDPLSSAQLQRHSLYRLIVAMLIRISLYLSLLTLFITSALSGPTGLHKRVDIQRYTGDGETSGRHLVLLKPGASREGVISQLANTVDVVYQWGTVCNGFAGESSVPSLRVNCFRGSEPWGAVI